MSNWLGRPFSVRALHLEHGKNVTVLRTLGYRPSTARATLELRQEETEARVGQLATQKHCSNPLTLPGRLYTLNPKPRAPKAVKLAGFVGQPERPSTQ